MPVPVSLVLFHSRAEHVAWTLAGLAAQRPVACGPVRLHVNEATPSELDGIRTVVSDASALVVDVTTSDGNDGFCAPHNRALAHLFATGATHVLVVNPDVRLAPDAVAALQNCDPAHRALTGPLLERAGRDSLDPEGVVDTAGIVWTRTGRHLDDLQGAPLDTAPRQPVRVRGLSGACLLVGRDAYHRVVAASGEFFDEDFFAYREDAELAIRAEALGVEMWLEPAARGAHVRTQRGTRRGGSPLIDRLGVRNRFLLAGKYGVRRPGWPPVVLLRDAVVVAGVVVRERSSLPGLREAWRLRHAMRAKRRRVREAARSGH